jgi:hypothetical protein
MRRWSTGVSGAVQASSESSAGARAGALRTPSTLPIARFPLSTIEDGSGTFGQCVNKLFVAPQIRHCFACSAVRGLLWKAGSSAGVHVQPRPNPVCCVGRRDAIRCRDYM